MAKLGQETAKFHEAYAKDPQAALDKYSYLSNMHLKCTLRFSSGGAEALFLRQRTGSRGASPEGRQFILLPRAMKHKKAIGGSRAHGNGAGVGQRFRQ
jgi:hypothetical protein